MSADGDRDRPCGARSPRGASRRCILPAGHAGSHCYALATVERSASRLANRSAAWWRSKTCPECRRKVMVAAGVCRACGHRFDSSRDHGALRAVEPRASVAAVVAMACSLIGVWVVSIPLGILARRAVAGSDGRLTGRGLATIAVGIGLIDMIATAVLVALLV